MIFSKLSVDAAIAEVPRTSAVEERVVRGIYRSKMLLVTLGEVLATLLAVYQFRKSKSNLSRQVMQTCSKTQVQKKIRKNQLRQWQVIEAED